MNSHEVFIHIHQGCFAGTGAIVRLPQCQWSKPDGYGKISQCITTTKHSKAKTVCIFLGIYCRSGLVGPQCRSSTACNKTDPCWLGGVNSLKYEELFVRNRYKVKRKVITSHGCNYLSLPFISAPVTQSRHIYTEDIWWTFQVPIFLNVWRRRRWWTYFFMKDSKCVSYIVNTMATDYLATQGARTSADLVLTYICQNNPVWSPLGLTH